jgi:hypothetical protein
MQMHLDAITDDCVGTGLQSSEEQTSRNISLDKTPRLWYGFKLLKLLEADCSLQATGRFLLCISDLLVSSLLFEYHIANPIATWQLSAWKLLLLLQATSFPEAESFKEDGCSQWIPLYEVTCSNTKMLTYLLTLCRGVARHSNYLWDAFSFSLPCGMRYSTLSMPECLTIFDLWFFCHPPGKYMSLNLDLFTCENHQYSGKIEKLQFGDFGALFSQKIIIMSFQIWYLGTVHQCPKSTQHISSLF